MAAQTFRHAVKLSASGHRLRDRILAMLALLYNAALEVRILAWRMSGKSISLYDQYKSLTTIRREDAEWRDIPVLVARSALSRRDRAMKAFFSRVQSGTEPGIPRRRAQSRYRSISVDDPKAARSAIRILDGGQRGELRMNGVPRMRFAIWRALPPMDRLRGFRVVRKAWRVERRRMAEAAGTPPSRGSDCQDLQFHCSGSSEDQKPAPRGPGEAGPEPGDWGAELAGIPRHSERNG